jgi:putative membrane protein
MRLDSVPQLRFLLVCACAAGAIAGCGSKDKASGTNPQPKAPAAPATSLSAQDQAYLMNSAEGDAFEVQGGKLALKMSKNPKVRKLATTLVSDHSKSLKEAEAMGKKFHVKVESMPSPSQAWELKIVASESGTAFDRWYAELETSDHHQDITEATFEEKNGQSSEVRDSAAKELPDLRKHLALSEAALG